MSVVVMPVGMADLMIDANIVVAAEFVMAAEAERAHHKLADQQRPPDGGTGNVERFHGPTSRLCALRKLKKNTQRQKALMVCHAFAALVVGETAYPGWPPKH